MGSVLPLLALRAFAETGRHGSIKLAADAMGVTSGAVSQQIRQLEERVGVALFSRTRYGMLLTEAGAKIHPPLLRAFDQIALTLGALETIKARQTLTVTTAPSFAASWLVPRLGRFSDEHPEFEVRVEATNQLVNLRDGRVDVAIRHGLGHYPGLNAIPLMAPELVPVGSARLLAGGPPIHDPVDCLAYPLLQDRDRADWPLWLKALGVEGDPRAERGPSFDDDFLLIRAAEAGQGLALVRDIYAHDEIAAGRLVLALDRSWPTQFAYYIVSLPEVANRPVVAAFSNWLLREAQKPDGSGGI
ncbi:LysR substrate-binding domain-containing protein [Phreatobacter stygius]|uniref:LysR family transcriptional regulator n=1 Tax=Phreatobacter stygius TaxID=1940610 RepID=A0A4D7B595_9HYPH|nr:LysR substrate-binding domain-containing protein [Phreatobacter stygius]QCI66163.1 LysR family transcriptional regulator [Phreatobacter stygius]